NQSHDAGIRAAGAQSGIGSEGKSSKDDGQVKLGVEPIERCAHVLDLAAALVMFALAEPSTAKVEAQGRESKAVQRLHGSKHNLVMHGAAEHGMRMADQRGMGSVGGAGIEQRFQLSCRAGNEE